MFLQDITYIITWWFTLSLLGFLSIPLTFHLFNHFFDSGYIYSKTLSILLLSYFVWIFASLKIIPFTYLGLLLNLFFLIILNFILLLKNYTSIKSTIISQIGIIIFEEVLFFSALVTWALLRGFLPDIRGLEKFMDYGFLNSIMSSTYFPPIDMWYASMHINYYYFGHLISAVLTKLSGITPAVTYNLMIATLFSLTLVSVFSLAGNMFFKKSKSLIATFFCGIIGAFLVTMGGNLHTIYTAYKNILVGNSPFLNYWYPDATRFIVQQFGAKDNTIHEFPIYSFVVADLHGHLVNLPTVLLFLAILFSILSSQVVKKTKLILISLIIGIFYITNSWDVPVYGLLLGLSLVYLYWIKYKYSPKTLLLPGVICLSTLIGGFIFTMPFHFTFKMIASGLALSYYHTPPWMLGILWGSPFLVTLLFLIYNLRIYKTSTKPDTINVFVFFMLLVSWLLIIFPEFFYIKDIYITSYQRANTMFKFTYQSFILFGISTAYILTNLAFNKTLNRKPKILKILPFIPILALTAILLIYPYHAIKSFYNLTIFQSLNGEYWLYKEYPGEYRALEWIRKNVKTKSVILTAPGDSYTDYGVINAYSGHPTVQGWLVHEWLWRGTSDDPTNRISDVETIYTSSDTTLTKELINKYTIDYLIIGRLEKNKYSNLNKKKLSTLAKLVFSSEGTEIYKVN